MKRLFRLSESRPDPTRDVDDEIHFHLEMRTREFMENGLSAEDARRAAMESFGDVTAIEAECRDVRVRRTRERARRDWLHGLSTDITYALRTLRKSKRFTFVAVLTLALGIGANTAIFSAVNAVLLRPLPTPGLDRLVVLFDDFPGLGIRNGPMAPGEAVDLAQRTDLFEASTAFRAIDWNLTWQGEGRRVSVLETTGEFFRVFGVHHFLGRYYGPEASEPGQPAVAVVSHAFWEEFAGGDSTLVGRTIQLNDKPYRVIGVLPAEFTYPHTAQVWVPFALGPDPIAKQRNRDVMTAVARLEPGITMEQLRAQLRVESDRWRQQYDYPAQLNASVTTTRFLDFYAGELRPILLALLGAVGFVLLIACANIASLQLVRAAGRAKEFTIRAALGAGRSRLVRQLLVESAVLTVAGAVVGVAVGAVAIHALAHVQLARFQALHDARLSAPTLIFTLVVSVVSGLLFGTAPALRAAKIQLNDALRESARGSSGGLRQHRFLQGSVVVQVALTLVLLLGSGLTIRSLIRLLDIDPGFRSEQVVSMQLSLSGARYAQGANVVAFQDVLLSRVRAIPGVRAAGLTYGLPFSTQWDNSPFEIIGRAPDAGGAIPHANLWFAEGDYFQAMGIPLLRGRSFAPTDNATAQHVAIIDETLAREFFPGQDPIGQPIRQGWTAVIIGVVGSVRHDALSEAPKPAVYYSFRQFPAVARRSAALVVRSTLPASSVVTAVRSVLSGLDKEIPLYDVLPMHERVAQSLGPRRFAVVLLGGFAALSLLLALLGIYGVLSYAINQRTQEIGIRMALGARPASVIAMVLRSGLALAGIGLVVGAMIYLGLGHLVAALLYGVSPLDPITLAACAVLLTAVALLACYLPARRAAHVDPTVALRGE